MRRHRDDRPLVIIAGLDQLDEHGLDAELTCKFINSYRDHTSATICIRYRGLPESTSCMGHQIAATVDEVIELANRGDCWPVLELADKIGARHIWLLGSHSFDFAAHLQGLGRDLYLVSSDNTVDNFTSLVHSGKVMTFDQAEVKIRSITARMAG